MLRFLKRRLAAMLGLMKPFSDSAWFCKVTFSGDAGFDGATFSGDTRFDEAAFNGSAWFGGATFLHELRAYGATFDKAASQEQLCRIAKRNCEEQGDKDEADYYHYREMEAKRKQKSNLRRYVEVVPFQWVLLTA